MRRKHECFGFFSLSFVSDIIFRFIWDALHCSINHYNRLPEDFFLFLSLFPSLSICTRLWYTRNKHSKTMCARAMQCKSNLHLLLSKQRDCHCVYEWVTQNAPHSSIGCWNVGKCIWEINTLFFRLKQPFAARYGMSKQQLHLKHDESPSLSPLQPRAM